MVTRSEKLRAELAMTEAEEAFVAIKTDPDRDEDAYRQAKHDLRAARQTFRELREQSAPDAGVARPGTVTAEVGVG